MNFALAVRAFFCRSANLAFAVLVLSVAPGLASAQSSPDNPPPAPTTGWACAHTEPVEGPIEMVSHHTCTCSGPGIDIAGEFQFGPVTLGVGQAPHKKDLDGLLVCQSYIIRASYDEYVSGGDTTVVSDEFMRHTFVKSNCDNSACGRVWGFLWKTGNATCVDFVTQNIGGHWGYKQTGRLCTDADSHGVTEDTSASN